MQETEESVAATFSVRLLGAHEHHQDVAVLSVHGEIDLGTAHLLRKVLLPVLEHQSGPVVVDLSEVPFMDSTGVHVLFDALRRLGPQNRPLAVVCHEEGQVDRVLTWVGLIDALTVCRSCESAVIAGDDILQSKPIRNSGTSDTRDAPGGAGTGPAPAIH
jgi:anti-sigma B factor antagonist